MGVNYRQISEIEVNSTLVLERNVKGKQETLSKVEVIKEPYQKNGVWYIPIKTVYDENGRIFEERQNFIQVVEYTNQGMFKIQECKLVYLHKESFIITKGHLKLINRRSSVRVDVSIESSFKVQGESVWNKSTAVDISLSGCRLRSSMVNYTEKDIQYLNERKPSVSINFKYNNVTMAVLGIIQRATMTDRGVIEIGCKVNGTPDYNGMCIAEQVKVAKLKR